jgi:hypothetical protein
MHRLQRIAPPPATGVWKFGLGVTPRLSHGYAGV